MIALVYRVYDVDDRLLYVGMSGCSAESRVTRHIRSQPWGAEINRFEVEAVPTLADARNAERAAIRAERPIWNLQGLGPETDRSSWAEANYRHYIGVTERFGRQIDAEIAKARFRARFRRQRNFAPAQRVGNRWDPPEFLDFVGPESWA